MASVYGYTQAAQGVDGADVMYDFLQNQIQMPGNTAPGATTSVEATPAVRRYLMLHAFPTTPTFGHVSVWEIQVQGNRLPIAPTVTLSTTTNHAVSITVADLLSRASDFDGDALALV